MALDAIPIKTWAKLGVVRCLVGASRRHSRRSFWKGWLRQSVKKNGSKYVVSELAIEVCDTRSGAQHYVWTHHGEARRQLPGEVIAELREQGYEGTGKVPVSWIAAYVAGKRPDKGVVGWEASECSHRCVEFGLNRYVAKTKWLKKRGVGAAVPYALQMWESCVDGDCLCWELKGDNQKRGHCASVCCKMCHCGCETLCEANRLHVPHCL